MIRICPKVDRWYAIYLRLEKFARLHPCTPPSPPVALILSGWSFTNDIEKKQQWEETVAWAANNNCAHLVTRIPDEDFYKVYEASNYTVGPFGGPMYRLWDFEPKPRPNPEQLTQYMCILKKDWTEIAGDTIGKITRPMAFRGKKARRLIVQADSTTKPPWGSWSALSYIGSERRTFTLFRTRINKVIAPHEVDHIDFTTHDYIR